MKTLFADEEERRRHIDFLVDRASTIALCAFRQAESVGRDYFRQQIRLEFASYAPAALNASAPPPQEPAAGQQEGARGRREAGECITCRRPVYHRPGKLGELDHDCPPCRCGHPAGDHEPDGQGTRWGCNECDSCRLYLPPDSPAPPAEEPPPGVGGWPAAEEVPEGGEPEGVVSVEYRVVDRGESSRLRYSIDLIVNGAEAINSNAVYWCADRYDAERAARALNLSYTAAGWLVRKNPRPAPSAAADAPGWVPWEVYLPESGCVAAGVIAGCWWEGAARKVAAALNAASAPFPPAPEGAAPAGLLLDELYGLFGLHGAMPNAGAELMSSVRKLLDERDQLVARAAAPPAPPEGGPLDDRGRALLRKAAHALLDPDEEGAPGQFEVGEECFAYLNAQAPAPPEGEPFRVEEDEVDDPQVVAWTGEMVHGFDRATGGWYYARNLKTILNRLWAARPAAPAPAAPPLPLNSRETLCPECGIGVSVDEEGSCVQCGATATGSAVPGILGSMRQLELYRKQCENQAEPPAPAAEGPEPHRWLLVSPYGDESVFKGDPETWGVAEGWERVPLYAAPVSPRDEGELRRLAGGAETWLRAIGTPEALSLADGLRAALDAPPGETKPFRWLLSSPAAKETVHPLEPILTQADHEAGWRKKAVYSAPPAVEPVAPSLIQVIHELLRVAEDSQRYLCERCCDEDATRLEVRLSDARRRMDEALHETPVAPAAPPPAMSEEVREAVAAMDAARFLASFHTTMGACDAWARIVRAVAALDRAGQPAGEGQP